MSEIADLVESPASVIYTYRTRVRLKVVPWITNYEDFFV